MFTSYKTWRPKAERDIWLDSACWGNFPTWSNNKVKIPLAWKIHQRGLWNNPPLQFSGIQWFLAWFAGRANAFWWVMCGGCELRGVGQHAISWKPLLWCCWLERSRQAWTKKAGGDGRERGKGKGASSSSVKQWRESVYQSVVGHTSMQALQLSRFPESRLVSLLETVRWTS